jgi:GAF domain-containing protein/anti-sigma regulatory factor (Ser/Thr protein kinase)
MPSEVSTAGADQHLGRVVDELKRELEAKSRELAEAREQQGATAGILAAISSSPADLGRVFAEIAANAARLCDAYDSLIGQLDGDTVRLVAHHGPIPTTGPVGQATLPLTRGSSLARAILDRQTIHVVDLQAEKGEYPEGSDIAHRHGIRTALNQPMMRSGKAIGGISIRRADVRPFTDRQIALLKTFADQAVIAIENTRLFEAEQARTRELSESLDRQTATSDVLSVISRSPTDLQSVFDAIAAKALDLCGAMTSAVCTFDGQLIHLAAADRFSADLPVIRENWPRPPSGATGRAILSKASAYIPDVFEDSEYPLRTIASVIGYRSILSVPMLHDERPIGAITISAAQPRAFSPKQIGLLQIFADQAVIAIENTRLFEAEQASKHELQESLEYQTAMSDVLGVISRSPNELQPVLDTIVLTAQRLCQAEYALIHTRREDDLFHLAASSSADPAFVEWVMENPIKAGDGSNSGLVLLEKKTVHWPDALAEPQFSAFRLREQSKARTMLGVPVQREGQVVAVLFLARTTVKPFSQRQIKLVETFADQAVIAIENTRLFEAEQASKRELQESLHQQTATADVLKVISRSALDLQRVLDALVESAARLCNAYDAAIFQVFGDGMRLVAHHGQIPLAGPVGQAFPLVRGHIVGRAVIDRRTIQVADTQAEADEYPESRSRALQLGYRTALAVPLVHAGKAIGVIYIRRSEVLPFTERQIELVNTFADQAVIAIENTRLFEEVQTRTKELQESLDRQTATSEVLGVISRSPNEVQPVLDMILATAQRLCQAERASVWRLEGETFRTVAHRGQPEELVESVYRVRVPVSREGILGRATLARRAVQVEDFATNPELVAVAAHAITRAGNIRTILAVPLLLKGQPIGAITLTRTRVARFDDKQVALVESFADQAVIAIENARLFEAEQASKRELARSVEELESLGKVSQAVNSSLELDKVLPTILEHACAMSYAGGGTVYVFDKTTSELRLAAAHNMSDEHIAMVRAQPMRLNSVVVGECATRREVVQVADLSSAAPSPLIDILLRTGVRAALAVPLLHQAEVVGVLVVRRNQPGTFSPEVIRLVEAFAAQSAIAVENARLFGEIAHKSRELEIASQHKSQFVANMSHELRTPLAAILGYAELMQEGFYEPLGQKSLDALTRIRSNGKHLLGLINTVLDIAKIESGQFTLNMAEYAIESVVETVRSATESLAQSKKLVLKTDVAKSMPIGLGDEQRLTQVLLNLVGNAIKFTDAGEVRVTAKAVNGHFNVSVADTGPGIPEQEQTRIFDQFHQVDSSLTKAKGGTGLGLAIAKQIVEMHGGRIWVESTVGKGSTFQMELPTRATAT